MFADSDADLATVAAVVQRLRKSHVFDAMMASAARRSIEAHLVSSDDLDTTSIDAPAVDALAEAVEAVRVAPDGDRPQRATTTFGAGQIACAGRRLA